MHNFNDLLGKEFDEQDQGPDSYNCWSLCREVCARGNVFLPQREFIYDFVERDIAIDESKADFISLDGPEPFCIVTFSLKHPWVTHMGVVLPPNGKRFIHIMRARRVVIERLDRPYWSRRIEGFYRYAGKSATDSSGQKPVST